MPAFGLVSPEVDSVVPMPPYAGPPSVVLMTPSPFVSAAVVGHWPLPPMWMCCTCGYAALPNFAARPLTCSVIVAVLPLSVIMKSPEPVTWLIAFKFAW